MQTRRKDPCFPPILSICTENRFAEIFISTVQCFAGYFDIEYGHLLDGEKQMGVIIIITPIRNAIITINTEYNLSS